MKRLHITGYVLLVLLFSSCSNEQESLSGSTWNELFRFVFTLHIPGDPLSVSSPDDVGETFLKSVFLLAFKDDGADETFLYATPGRNITGTGNQKQFTVSLNPAADGNDRHRFVVLANPGEAAEQVIRTFTAATTRQEALKAITVAMENKWSAASSGNFAPLPMWGESAGSHVVTPTLQPDHIGEIAMLRTLARVDIGLNYDGTTFAGPASLFRLGEVLVYNYSDRAAIAPESGRFDRAGGVVTGASVPDNANSLRGPLVYAQPNSGEGFMKEIYLAETPGTGAADQQLALVVGGYYKGSAAKSWYRIALDSYAGGKPFALLRNHRYLINITSVSGPGFSTPEEAYHAVVCGMNAEVIPWNEANTEDIVIDKPYRFAVSQSSFTLGPGAYSDVSMNNDLSLFSDIPSGWSVEKYTDESGNPVSWLSLSPAEGAADATVAARVITSDNTGEERKAKVYLRAGRFRYVLNVTQHPPGGGGDLLYFQPDGTLQVGRWGKITQSNVAYFKFGSVVGFTNTSSADNWDLSDVKYNVTGSATYAAYTEIPVYTAADYNAGVLNISKPDYHNGANIKQGKGDPCKLVGLKAAQIQSMTAEQLHVYDSGWRLPSNNENLDFVGAPASWYNSIVNPGLSNSTCTYWGYSPTNSGRGGWFPIPGDREATSGRTVRNTALSGYLHTTGYRYVDSYSYGIGSIGGYWANSASSNKLGSMLMFHSSSVFPMSSYDYASAFTIRCVRQ